MKKKLITGGIIGAVVLGGAFGANAMTNDGDDWNGQKASLSQEEAEKTAKEEISGLTINKVEKDEDAGRLIYEVDGTTKDGLETDVDIDANTGEVIETDRDDDSDDNQNAAEVKITKEEAEQAAKKEGKGKIEEIELDDGHYEVEMSDGKDEYEIKIDGQTGEVIESKKDQDDD